MKTKGHQNRFLRIITIPIRALGKARDFYVRSITNYADRGSCGSAMGMPPSTYGVSLPRSFSATSSRSHDSEDFSELLRAASTRTLAESDLSLYVQQEMRRRNQQQPQPPSFRAGVVGLQKMPPRSSSVGMGKIDEDKPCCAFGDQEKMYGNQKLVYPRSRSYAVNKKSLVF